MKEISVYFVQKIKNIFEFNDLEISSKEAQYPLAPISPERPLERNKKK